MLENYIFKGTNSILQKIEKNLNFFCLIYFFTSTIFCTQKMFLFKIQ